MWYTPTALHSSLLWTPRPRMLSHRAGNVLYPVSFLFVNMTGSLLPVQFANGIRLPYFQPIKYRALHRSRRHIGRQTGRHTVKVLLRFHTHIRLPSVQ